MSSNGYISKGITLSYCSTSDGVYTVLTDLQEIPDLGGEVETVEITTLADAAHRYRSGLISYGDSLAFIFLYEPTQFATLNGLTGSYYWEVGLPDGDGGAIDTIISFSGDCSVKLNGVGTSAPLTYTLSISPNSLMTIA